MWKLNYYYFFRFRRELHYQLPPIRENINDYQLNLRSFVKIHPHQIQWDSVPSPLSSNPPSTHLLHEPHNVSTPIFHPNVVVHSQTYCLQASTLLVFLGKGVGSIVTKWMKPQGHKKQTLTFLHAVLPTWEQTAKSSKCPTAPSMNYRIR